MKCSDPENEFKECTWANCKKYYFQTHFNRNYLLCGYNEKHPNFALSNNPKEEGKE
jgi:hypothetical protein